MSPAEWTVTPPTEPGWYWVASVNADGSAPNDYSLELLFYFPAGGHAAFRPRLTGTLISNYDIRGDSRFKITHWLGPLPVPLPPAPDAT